MSPVTISCSLSTMTYETVAARSKCAFSSGCAVLALNIVHATVEDIMFYETSLVFYCSQMMEMSRDVWKSSPNVIAKIEMEA